MRSVLKLSALAVWLLLAGIAAGCADGPVTPGPPPKSPTPGPTSASLAIEDPLVLVRASPVPDRFDVEVRFLLRETGGNSGAAIEAIDLYDIRGVETLGGDCTKGLRVPPGSVVDTFYSDEGYKSLGYCAPAMGRINTPTPAHPINVTVTFLDDDGRRGWADARALVEVDSSRRASAVLAIEDPFVIVRSSRLSARFEVEVRFLLRETGGNSGATIRSIFLSDGRGGGEMRDGICTEGLRVPAGGVLHTLYTDEGFGSRGYCSTYWGTISTPTFNNPVIVTVTFADDEGRVGSVAGRTVVK